MAGEDLDWLPETNQPRTQRKALIVWGESKVAPFSESLSVFGWFTETNLPPAHLIEIGALFGGQIPNYVFESKAGEATGEDMDWFLPFSEPSAYLVPPGRPDLYAPFFMGQRLHDVDTGIETQIEWLVPLSEPSAYLVPLGRPDLYAPSFVGQPLHDIDTGTGGELLDWLTQPLMPSPVDARADLYVSAFSFQIEVPSVIPEGGQTPFVVYDFEEAERQERERLRDEAELLEEIQDMLGPSQELINNIWTVALLKIEEDPIEVIEVQYDIDDRNLLRLTRKYLEGGSLDSEKATRGVIKSPDSTVTFMKTEDGWLFFRTKGTA